jgi:hypothetical protein
MTTDAFIELLKMLPATHIERLMATQYKVQDQTKEPRTMPESNSRSVPPSNRRGGIYQGPINA